MDRIGDSLKAIQDYKPENNVYLRVVGEGKDQCLIADNISWFGRLLIWLGCSSACMSKVAKFLDQHMQALCFAKIDSLREDQNPFRKLVDRVIKYNDNHRGRISHAKCRIESAYNLARQHAVATAPNVQPAPGAVPTQTPVPPPQQPQTPAQPFNPPAPPAGKKGNPTPLCFLTVPEAVDCFKAARGHIGKAVDLILDKKAYKSALNLKKAPAKEVETVQQLLKDCTSARFAAVVKEMTPEEVGHYVAFAVSSSSEAPFIDEIHDIYKDIFEIKKGQRFAPSPLFKLAVTHMSVDQLKAMMGSIDKYWTRLISFKNVYYNVDSFKDVFYNLAQLIRELRTRAEQQVLIGEMVKLPCYTGCVLENIDASVWRNPANGAQLTADTLLAETYLCYLLRDPAVMNMPWPYDRAHHISDFVSATHFKVYDIACNSPLQNRAFLLQLSSQEKHDVAAAIVKNARKGKALTDSVLITELLKDRTYRGPGSISGSSVVFRAAMGSTIVESPEFCTCLRQSDRWCDVQFVQDLLHSVLHRDRDTLMSYVKRGGLPDNNSVLNEEWFDNLLDDNKRRDLCCVLFEASDASLDPLDPKKLDQFYVIRERVMKLALFAFSVYKELKKIPTYDANRFLDFCNINAPAILKSIVGKLDAKEKRSWDDYKIKLFQQSALFKAMSPADQQKALASFSKSL